MLEVKKADIRIVALSCPSNELHYIAVRWTGKIFEAFNVHNDDTSSRKYASVESFFKDKAYKAISLISIS